VPRSAVLEWSERLGWGCGCSVRQAIVGGARQFPVSGGRPLGVAGSGRLQKCPQFGPSNEHFRYGRAALWRTAALFRRVAGQVADALGFVYPQSVDDEVSASLRRVQQMPRDAQPPQCGQAGPPPGDFRKEWKGVS